MFYKMVVLKNVLKLIGKHLSQRLFIKKKALAQVFFYEL